MTIAKVYNWIYYRLKNYIDMYFKQQHDSHDLLHGRIDPHAFRVDAATMCKQIPKETEKRKEMSSSMH